ncbi:hypothetical protein [Candidatus Foliamicus sp.]
METNGVIAFEHEGHTFKAFRFVIGDQGESLAVMAPPKYVDAPNKRCFIEKRDLAGQPSKYEFLVNNHIASLGGIAIEYLGNNIWRTMMQANTQDVKMHWHADGNFHISGTDLPGRTENPFVSSAKNLHGFVPTRLNNKPEIFLQMLGWIHISRSEAFLRPQNRMEEDIPDNQYCVSLGEAIQPKGIFICRVRTVSGVKVDPKVMSFVHEPGLKYVLAELIKSPAFGGLTEDCVDLIEDDASLTAVQGAENKATFFAFYVCPLVEKSAPRYDWFISSVKGDDDVVLSLTVKSKSDWWPA